MQNKNRNTEQLLNSQVRWVNVTFKVYFLTLLIQYCIVFNVTAVSSECLTLRNFKWQVCVNTNSRMFLTLWSVLNISSNSCLLLATWIKQLFLDRYLCEGDREEMCWCLHWFWQLRDDAFSQHLFALLQILLTSFKPKDKYFKSWILAVSFLFLLVIQFVLLSLIFLWFLFLFLHSTQNTESKQNQFIHIALSPHQMTYSLAVCRSGFLCVSINSEHNLPWSKQEVDFNHLRRHR